MNEATRLLVKMLFEERDTRIGLAHQAEENKDAIEELMEFVQELKDDRDRLTRELEKHDLLVDGSEMNVKIAFIKLIREVSGAGLKESKEWVDQFIADHTLKTLE